METHVNAPPTFDFDGVKTNSARVASEDGSGGLGQVENGEDSCGADSMLGVDE